MEPAGEGGRDDGNPFDVRAWRAEGSEREMAVVWERRTGVGARLSLGPNEKGEAPDLARGRKNSKKIKSRISVRHDETEGKQISRSGEGDGRNRRDSEMEQKRSTNSLGRKHRNRSGALV